MCLQISYCVSSDPCALHWVKPHSEMWILRQPGELELGFTQGLGCLLLIVADGQADLACVNPGHSALGLPEYLTYLPVRSEM